MERYTFGDFRFEFNEGDIFRVYWRGIEVAQRIYVAVRDEAWNTIPAEIANVKIDETSSSLQITFDAVNRYAEMNFAWQGKIIFSSNNVFSIQMLGKANSAFKYCKIGFNVHHGLGTHKGLTFISSSIEGLYRGEFGDEIMPQLVKNGTLTAMTPPYEDLSINYGDFIGHFHFSGDLFEMQDHRNWGDDNWKSYGTPLAKGFPFDAKNGDLIEQTITFTVEEATQSSGRQERALGIDSAGVLPYIGLNVLHQITKAEVDLLKPLRFDHLRVNLAFSSPNWDLFDSVVEAARMLNSKIEVGLFLPENISASQLKKFVEPLFEERELVVRIFALTEKSGYSAFQGATDPGLSGLLESALPTSDGIDISSGTDQFFSDVNRLRPKYDSNTGLVFAYNPQVHSGDDLSIMQNASPIRDIATFIYGLYGTKKISLSPVEFLGAAGPYPLGPSPKNGLAPNVDPRLWGQLGAAWTCALLAHSSVAKVHSLTLFEVSGPRGILGPGGEKTEIYSLLREIAEARSQNMSLVKILATPDNQEVQLIFADSVGKNRVEIKR